MSLKITVTFPCSLEDYKKTIIILNAMQKVEFPKAPIKSETKASVDEIESLISELTDDEKKILDFQLKNAHESNDTPVLDSFETAEVATMSVNRTAKILEYFKKHPHATKRECTEYLATKLAKYYPSRDIAIRRLGILVGALVHDGRLINNATNKYNGTYLVSEGI